MFLVRQVRRGRGATVLSRDKTEVSRWVAIIDGFAPSLDGAALLDDRLLAPPSTERAVRSADTNWVVGVG